MLDERSDILNVFHLPDIDKKILYNSVSPVNTFRLIFNSYFNSQFELLDDSTFFSNEFAPYSFTNLNELKSR